jgi:hypothetical protein
MLIGHKKIVEDLKFLVKKDALPHGFIFAGPGMAGKRTAALALANFLEHGNFEPPAEGAVLQDAKMIDLASMKLIDPDASGDSIGIDAAREIKNFLWQRPNVSIRRTLIIDDAAMMTNEAQNAILKITEEPPVSSLLILISSDTEGLLPTILSRLQKVSFGIVQESDIARWLEEDHAVPAAKAVAAAKKSFGKPGLAWRLVFDKTLEKNIASAEKFLELVWKPASVATCRNFRAKDARPDEGILGSIPRRDGRLVAENIGMIAGCGVSRQALTTATIRRDVVKKIIEPDDFNMRIFLDAVMLVLAWNGAAKNKTALWHKTLALYGRIENFSLNPRLQLENLLME